MTTLQCTWHELFQWNYEETADAAEIKRRDASRKEASLQVIDWGDCNEIGVGNFQHDDINKVIAWKLGDGFRAPSDVDIFDFDHDHFAHEVHLPSNGGKSPVDFMLETDWSAKGDLVEFFRRRDYIAAANMIEDRVDSAVFDQAIGWKPYNTDQYQAKCGVTKVLTRLGLFEYLDDAVEWCGLVNKAECGADYYIPHHPMTTYYRTAAGKWALKDG